MGLNLDVDSTIGSLRGHIHDSEIGFFNWDDQGDPPWSDGIIIGNFKGVLAPLIVHMIRTYDIPLNCTIY